MYAARIWEPSKVEIAYECSHCACPIAVQQTIGSYDSNCRFLRSFRKGIGWCLRSGDVVLV